MDAAKASSALPRPKEEQDESQSSQSASQENELYTSFTSRQLRGLQLLLGLSAITSPLTATIYLPLLPLLRVQFSASAQEINLTLTVYIIFQAVSPVLFGPLSDTYGRRPMFLITLAIYLVSSIGLAANEHNYAALLCLRAVQSLGASAAYAIAFGVVADVCDRSQRGRMLGPIGMALNLGACVGPVVGGVVAHLRGNHIWVFWALAIVAAVLLGGVGMFLPETGRNLVGDGSDVRRFKWWQRSGMGLVKGRLQSSHRSSHAGSLTSAGHADNLNGRAALKKAVGNFISCFRIIFHRDTFLTVWMHGSFYVVDYTFVAALPDIFERIYDYNELRIGLCYLPRGVGIIVGSYLTGKLMDHNYQATLRQHRQTHGDGGETVADASRVDPDPTSFPIERARSRGTYYVLAVSTGTVVGYGWAVSLGAHPSIPLILQFLQGFWGTYYYTTYGALMVDAFPEKASTASAATSVARCAMSAAGVAVLEPLLGAVGRGWYFTILGLWSGILGVIAVILLRKMGLAWRCARGGGQP